MSLFTDAIFENLQLSLGYAKRLLVDVPSDQCARFASPGGQSVVSNHPAFIYGHLSLYPSKILSQLGGSALALPDGFEKVFSHQATCVDDADGDIYPEMEKITEFFFEGYHAAGDAITKASDETLAQPNPGSGRIVELFPTLGSMQNFYVGGHMMIHMGQMSAWRRMIGLSPA